MRGTEGHGDVPGGAAGQAHDGVERVDGRQVRLELRREGGEGGRVGGRRRRGEQEAGGGDEVDAAVEQEAALEGRGFAPGRLCFGRGESASVGKEGLAAVSSTLVFGALGHKELDLGAEVEHSPQRRDLRGCMLDRRHEAEVLGHAPADGFGVDGAAALVPFQQGAGGGHVWGDGLLG